MVCRFFERNKLHHFNGDMVRAFYSTIQLIHNKYNNDARNIWNDKPSSSILVLRFLEMEGVGIKIATMAANSLSRDYGLN